MIGLDNNVLVRYFTQDDREQARLANEVIESLSETGGGYVSLVTMVELYWVLRRAYHLQTDAVTDTIARLVAAREVTVDRADVIRSALSAARAGDDFADAVIASLGLEAGCQHTVTFDRGAARLRGMTLLGATTDPGSPGFATP